MVRVLFTSLLFPSSSLLAGGRVANEGLQEPAFREYHLPGFNCSRNHEYSQIVTLEDRAVTFGTVSDWRKPDIRTNFIILLKAPSFHKQQTPVCSPSCRWSSPEEEKSVRRRRHTVSLSSDSAPPVVSGEVSLLLSVVNSFLYRNESFWILHSEILGLYLRSFKKPSTNPVSLWCFLLNRMTFVLHCGLKRLLWEAQSQTANSSKPLPFSTCLHLFDSPSCRETVEIWPHEGLLLWLTQSLPQFLICWDLIG